MAAEERSGPRPQRGDRPQFGGDRGSFGGDRGSFGGNRPPFRPGPRPDGLVTPHTLRLRDGEREIEVSGSAPFVRQVLDDLPALLAKLHGEAAMRPAAIRMPAATEPIAATEPAAIAEVAALEVLGSALEAAPAASTGNGTVEDRVLAILRESRRPLAVAAIRKRLGSDVTPQQVRRVLERAGNRVSASNQRPATYRLNGR